MHSFRILSTFTALALIASAACGDSVTQATPKPKPADGPIASTSADTTPPPILTVTSSIASTTGFTGTGRPGQFLRVETVGSGFPPGVWHVERVAFVLRVGGVEMPATGIGAFVADGSIKASYGQSCPSPYAEAFAIVTYNAKTVESKHVPTAC